MLPESYGRKFNRETNSEDISEEKHDMSDENTKMTPLVGEKQRDEAAVNLQKTYKCFRTRRRLADCAILIEQRWLILDIAMVIIFNFITPSGSKLTVNNPSSIGKIFFAQQVTQTNNLISISTSKFDVVLWNIAGHQIFLKSGRILDTRGGPKDTKWIFVLSVLKDLNIGMKQKGTFQHSSFLAGGATLSAGRLVIEDGILKKFPSNGEDASFARKDGVLVFVIAYLHQILAKPPMKRAMSSAQTTFELFTKAGQRGGSKNNTQPLDTPEDGYETTEEYLSDTELSVSKQNLFARSIIIFLHCVFLKLYIAETEKKQI
ncbi:hypothetical protein FXO38_23102 [Capsicum annuum]|nr:hypothetical protein FXO38_23102 [Capsicum annuum]